jgi:hypothetical protein
MSESNVKFTRDEALDFHSRGRPGKIEIIASKPMRSPPIRAVPTTSPPRAIWLR